MTDLRKKYEDKNDARTAHIIVTHGGNIQAYLNYLQDNSQPNNIKVAKKQSDCAIAAGIV